VFATIAVQVNRPESVNDQAARIGGNEFMVLLPGTDERAGETVVDSIRHLLPVNNRY